MGYAQEVISFLVRGWALLLSKKAFVVQGPPFNQSAKSAGIQSYKSFRLFLIRAGYLTEDQLLVTEKESERQDLSFVVLLNKLGFLEEKMVVEALCIATGLPSYDHRGGLNLQHGEIYLPYSLAESAQILYLGHEGEKIYIGVVNPFQIQALSKLHTLNPHCASFHKVILPYSFFLKKLRESYKPEKSLWDHIQQLEHMHELGEEEMGPDKSLIKFVDSILEDALLLRASDIHLSPEGSHVCIFYRIDGSLFQQVVVDQYYWEGICIRFKVISHLNIAESRLPQSGSFQKRVRGGRVSFRLSTHPTQNGETITIRILDRDLNLIRLSKLGFKPRQVMRMERALRKPHGIIIVSGATGSGKTITLYAMMAYLLGLKKNIMSLEAPIEYNLPGVRQSNIAPPATFTFEEGIRSAMRHDPDVIVVGEVRDKETARMAIRAALTGHLLMTSLHSPDAWGALRRLYDLGISAEELEATVSLIIAQKLKTHKCPACSPQTTNDGQENTKEIKTLKGSCQNMSRVSFSAKGSTWSPKGPEKETIESSSNTNEGKDFSVQNIRPRRCPLCKGTGYHGRYAVGEVLIFETPLEKARISRTLRSGVVRLEK